MQRQLPPDRSLTSTLGRVAHVQGPSWAHPWLEDVVRRLPRYGWEPVVITLAPEGSLHVSLGALGIAALALDCGSRRHHPLAALRLARALRGVALVHAHLFDAALVSSVAGAIVRRPVVITRHEGPQLVRRAAGGGLNRALYHTLDRMILRRAAAVIAPSSLVYDEVLALGAKPSRARKILLGADMRRLGTADRARADALRQELAPRSQFVALAAGRLSWEKRIDVILRAWARVVAVRRDAAVLIAGDGPQRGTLERLAGELGIAGAVSFLGWRADVPELMLAADVVAHGSAIESTGLVLLEALALARPLVATPVGIVNEYLADKVHCLVVPHDDPSALAQALLHVAAAPEQAAVMGQAGRDAVMRRSGIEPMVAAYAALYQELATAPRRASRP